MLLWICFGFNLELNLVRLDFSWFGSEFWRALGLVLDSDRFQFVLRLAKARPFSIWHQMNRYRIDFEYIKDSFVVVQGHFYLNKKLSYILQLIVLLNRIPPIPI